MSARSFVVLVEDSSRSGPAIGRRLVTAVLQCLVEGLATHELVFDPPPPGVSRLVHAQQWTERRLDRTDLVRSITTELQKGNVVVFHYDADCPWPEPSHADEKFEKHVGAPVRRMAGASAGALVRMVPYTCIEAWTYRNLTRAVALCEEQGWDPTPHIEWAQDPSLLESTRYIKRLSPLADRHNLALVESGWPRREAYGDGRSFARLVDCFRAVPDLVAHLPRRSG